MERDAFAHGRWRRAVPCDQQHGGLLPTAPDRLRGGAAAAPAVGAAADRPGDRRGGLRPIVRGQRHGGAHVHGKGGLGPRAAAGHAQLGARTDVAPFCAFSSFITLAAFAALAALVALAAPVAGAGAGGAGGGAGPGDGL